MEIFLETERLLLRQLTEADADDLIDLNSDPEVMQFLTNGKPPPPEDTLDRVLPRVLSEYSRFPGRGRWAAIEKSTGEFLGWMSLAPVEDDPTRAGLGYRLRRSAWGKGYASEGARALVRKAFTEAGLEEVYAETMAVNTGSRKVMENAGLRYRRTFHPEFDDPIPGTELGEVEYAITRSEWTSSSTD